MDQNFLIHGRWVITEPEAKVFEDAGVLIQEGKIMEVAPWQPLRAAHPGLTVLGGPDSAVIPGLINAHHHSHAVPSILNGIPDMLLEPWILAWQALRSMDRYLDTLVSSGVQLGAGVTSVVDMMSAGGSEEEFATTLNSALDAHEKAGLRVALAPGCATQSFLVSGAGEDDRFLRWLPEDIRSYANALLPGPDRLTEQGYFSVMQSLHQRNAGNDRVMLWYGPPGPQWVTDKCLQRVAGEAERWNCGIQTHVNESFYEKLHGPGFYGKPTMTHLDELGILGPRFSIAHGTWLNQEEIEIMARTGAAVSHNPSSNLRLRAGIAPFHALLRQGVTVGIGMDSTTLNDNEDMFSEIRLAARLQCDPVIDRSVPSTADVVTAATVGGARLMGKEQEIGRLLPGYAADIVILDLNRITWPWLAPECDPLDVIYLRAQRQDIDRVLIDGEIVWQDGAPTRFDLPAAARELAAKVSVLAYPEDRKLAVETVIPYLEKWYAAWDAPAPDPWKAYNSRR